MYKEFQIFHKNSKNARIRKLPIRVFARKDMHLENMVLHALITTNVYSELTTAIQMLFVLIMVADFIVIARRGFQKTPTLLIEWSKS